MSKSLLVEVTLLVTSEEIEAIRWFMDRAHAPDRDLVRRWGSTALRSELEHLIKLRRSGAPAPTRLSPDISR